MTRREFVMTPAQLDKLLDACKATPYLLGSGGVRLTSSPQENANRAWEALGREMGFASATVMPVAGKGEAWFTAVPVKVDKTAKPHVDETANLQGSPPATLQPTGTEAAVCADIARRQAFGIAKYGVTVADNPLTLRQWLQHAYEETLDQEVYLKRAIAEIDALADSEGGEPA